jgi:hypothetical protein
MTLYGRSSRWAAALALGLAGLIGVGATTVPAAPARTTASAFELTLEGEITMTSDGELTSQGTFRSQAPFCATGTFVDEGPIRYGSTKRRFTCDDGTGSLTVSIALREYYASGGLNTTWQILRGSGSNAGLRGRGSLQSELLSEEGFAKWRSTLEGDVGRDAVAPRIDFSSATATKLGRPAGAYALRLRVALRDNVTDNPVSYTLRASAGGVELARRFGTTRTKIVSMTLRIRPRAGARIVRLALTGKDPVGNAVSVRRTLRLPR